MIEEPSLILSLKWNFYFYSDLSLVFSLLIFVSILYYGFPCFLFHFNEGKKISVEINSCFYTLSFCGLD